MLLTTSELSMESLDDMLRTKRVRKLSLTSFLQGFLLFSVILFLIGHACAAPPAWHAYDRPRPEHLRACMNVWDCFDYIDLGVPGTGEYPTLLL